MAIYSGGRDAVALTVFRRLGGNALAISGAWKRSWPMRGRSPPRELKSCRSTTGDPRAGVNRQRPRCDADRRVLQRPDPSGLPQESSATLITALAIPLSLVISFLFLRLTGDTLNLMSLGGLAVAIGLIIDDSVVVVENIARHLAEGQTGDEAIDRASREISGAVVGSTLTTILVSPPGLRTRGNRPILPVAESGPDCGPFGLDGGEPDAHPRAGVAVPGPAAMPSTGPIYAVLAGGYEGCFAPVCGSRGSRCSLRSWRSCPAGGFSST